MAGFRSSKVALLATIAILGGCAGMSEGPALITPVADAELESLRLALRRECLDVSGLQQPAPPAVEDRARRRNELVTAFMTAADLTYRQYERDLLAFSRQNDLGASLATQLLAVIGGASGSQDLSRAANLTTGAVNGTQSAFAKSLLGQTVSVLQTHMRAQRAAQNALIIERLAWDYETWNNCQAFSAAVAYEQAGTLNAALAAMAASATDEERRNEGAAQQALREVNFSAAPLPAALRAYFQRGAEQQRAGLAALNALIANGTIARPDGPVLLYLIELYSGDAHPQEQAALARQIVKDDDSEAGQALAAALPQ